MRYCHGWLLVQDGEFLSFGFYFRSLLPGSLQGSAGLGGNAATMFPRLPTGVHCQAGQMSSEISSCVTSWEGLSTAKAALPGKAAKGGIEEQSRSTGRVQA